MCIVFNIFYKYVHTLNIKIILVYLSKYWSDQISWICFNVCVFLWRFLFHSHKIHIQIYVILFWFYNWIILYILIWKFFLCNESWKLFLMYYVLTVNSVRLCSTLQTFLFILLWFFSFGLAKGPIICGKRNGKFANLSICQVYLRKEILLW